MSAISRLDLKTQAKVLRQLFLQEGVDISHGRALEMLAAIYGDKDWNTLVAKTKDEKDSPKTKEVP